MNPQTRMRKAKRKRSGQALIEFVLVAVMVISMLSILSLFLYTFRAYGGRVLGLVASEYP